MKTPALSLLILLALTACSDSTDEEAAPAPETATSTDLAAGAPVQPTPSATDAKSEAEIPAIIRGRWALTPADCTDTQGAAKGLLEITANKLDFYESSGTLDDIKELGETRIRAVFDFTGEGQEWERDITLEAREGGTVLIRREDGVDAAPGDFRYSKCG